MQSYSQVFLRGKRWEPNAVAIWTAVPDHLDSIRNTWAYLNRVAKCPHFLWDPKTGDLIEGVPSDYTGTVFPGIGYSVMVMCNPEDPFTSYPLEGAEILSKTLSALGVPEVWPMGPPSLSVALRPVQRVLPAGHYSADQINPEWSGVGSIDVRRLHGPHAG